MGLSNYELSVISMIRDEVDIYLKSQNFKKSPEKSNISSTLVKLLPNLTAGKSFTVTINSSSNQPFIMAMYPDIKELDKCSTQLVQLLDDPRSDNNKYLKVWGGIQNWTLEIDARVLLQDCPLCVRTGSEFVAILCHEIGHVMLEDPYRLVTNYKRQKAIMNRFNKLASCRSRFVRKLMLPIFINTLSFRITSRNPLQLHKEISADGYVPEEYRGSLLSYIEDCILCTPDSQHIITNEASYDTEHELSIKFSNDALTMMRNRMDALKHHLTVQYNDNSTGSEYHKRIARYISKEIAHYDPESEMSNMIMENKLYRQFEKEMELCENAAQIALESTKVTDRDLTILEVQCDEVKKTEDKIYLIHTIYDFIEAIQKENEARLKKTKDAKIKEFIKNDTRLTRLNKCREIVLNKDTTDVGDQYGVFVRYPKGYEG